MSVIYGFASMVFPWYMEAYVHKTSWITLPTNALSCLVLSYHLYLICGVMDYDIIEHHIFRV